MARRIRPEDEHENHERWLVSYADFITLLFAFFVVMYAISQVNEGKYRVLSDTLSGAFRRNPVSTDIQPTPIPSGALVPFRRPNSPAGKSDERQRIKKEQLRNLAKEVNAALAPLVKEGQVKITEGALGVTIDINASVLFSPGDARLDTGAVQALTAVSRVLAPTDFPIVVEGHTDNTPINTPQFPSNWELSGMRASAVVRLFIDNGVDSRRLTATGYADQRPVDDNATPEGRSRNRRVAITIESRTPDNPVEVKLP